MVTLRNDVLKDLALAAGWAVFVAVGIALGLVLGSLGADVPADSGMLVFIGVIAAVGTLVVRLGMVGWKYRSALPSVRRPGTASPAATSRPPKPLARAEAPEPLEAARKRPATATRKPPATARRPAPAKKATPAKPAPSTGAKKTAAAKKPAAAKKKPAPAKRPPAGGGAGRSRSS